MSCARTGENFPAAATPRGKSLWPDGVSVAASSGNSIVRSARTTAREEAGGVLQTMYSLSFPRGVTGAAIRYEQYRCEQKYDLKGYPALQRTDWKRAQTEAIWGHGRVQTETVMADGRGGHGAVRVGGVWNIL